MARVIEAFLGKDGIVRSVLIKTHDGTYKRPVVKLVPLFNERFQSENGDRRCWRLINRSVKELGKNPKLA